jgi:hypothetical protein
MIIALYLLHCTFYIFLSCERFHRMCLIQVRSFMKCPGFLGLEPGSVEMGSKSILHEVNCCLIFIGAVVLVETHPQRIPLELFPRLARII